MAGRRFHPGRADAGDVETHLKNIPLSFWLFKAGVDWAVVLLLLPGLLLCMGILLVCNPIWNRGPMFFHQDRAGRNGRVFRISKFRTMEGQGQSPAFEAGERAPGQPAGGLYAPHPGG